MAGTAILAATTFATGAAQASTTSDPLCRAARPTAVYNGSGSVIYTIHAGHDMRVHHYESGWFYGHGNGHSDGWAPASEFGWCR